MVLLLDMLRDRSYSSSMFSVLNDMGCNLSPALVYVIDKNLLWSKSGCSNSLVVTFFRLSAMKHYFIVQMSDDNYLLRCG